MTSIKITVVASLITFLLPVAAQAQVGTSITDSDSVNATSETTTDSDTSTNFDDEGLTDSDLETNLAAEALPTTNGVTYWWERVRDNLVSVFTFNAEKKAAQYRVRLHRLDRKAAACAQIGDEECLVKVEKHQQALQDRAERFIARRQELKDKLEARFTDWRQQRSERQAEWKLQAVERSDQRQELLQQRRDNRSDARQSRRQQLQLRRQQGQDTRLDRRSDRQQLRQQQLEQRSLIKTDPANSVIGNEGLIRARSRSLNDRLNNVRETVEQRKDQLERPLLQDND